MRKSWIVLLSLILTVSIAIPCGAQENSESEAEAADSGGKRTGGVKSLEKRIEQLEEAIGRDVKSDKWYDRIRIGGLVEVEAGYSKEEFDDPTIEATDAGDIDLATVELGADAKISRHVDAHVLLKWEPEGDEPLFVDEGFITLVGTETMPVYLIAGRQYVPFGNFDSHFVTDPVTLILGETNEGALVGGYRFGGETVDISAGAFNAKIDEAGSDSSINNFVAAVSVSPADNLMFGASYISNIASSDSLSEMVVAGQVNSFVGGWGAYVSYSFLDKFKLIGEYIGAAGDFEAGELYGAGDSQARRPQAWNIELGYAVSETLEIAARYGGSKDGGHETSGEDSLLLETEYGAVVNWGIFGANLAIEYLQGAYENQDRTTTVTAQLAVEF